MTIQSKEQPKSNGNIFELIGNLSSQSTESSNIILKAISQGISTGISQGIASGNISLSFQDVISLATVFKPKDDVALRLIDGLMPKGNVSAVDSSLPPPIQSKNPDIAKALANPDSHVSSQDSFGLPSSVHVFDITTESHTVQKHAASFGMSENADDNNAESNVISLPSSGQQLDESTTQCCVPVASSALSKKRSFQEYSEYPDNVKNPMRPRIESTNTQDATIHSLMDLCDYVSSIPDGIPEAVAVAHNNTPKSSDLMNYIYCLINLCQRPDVRYHHQSLVVLESKPLVDEGDDGSNYFNINQVSCVIAIERPHFNGQLYIAEGLSSKYHFSCPTNFLPSLFEVISNTNNKDLQLLFIPQTTRLFKGDNISVCNGIPFSHSLSEDDVKNVYRDVLHIGDSGPAQGTTTTPTKRPKRTNHAFSIGLQTMYAHQQHSARYSMLPHSLPHIPDVRTIPTALMDSIMKVYELVQNIMRTTMGVESHPFVIQKRNGCTEFEVEQRVKLRNDLSTYLKRKGIVSGVAWPSSEEMFEACAIQPTDALTFHKDTMNCPSIDKTIAFFAPSIIDPSTCGTNGERVCLTYLFYSRKCVGDHAKKIAKMKLYDTYPESCKLTRLCIRSILRVGGMFDYQGSIFEANESMECIALRLENDPKHSCSDIQKFTGLSCFKHGAAFDKMGYYSILPNVFLSLYYNNIIVDTNDTVSLCMYFGLLCNGTSSLAAVWSTTYDHMDSVRKWLGKRDHPTKLFECLYKLYGKRFGPEVKNGVVLYGNSKLPRYQYSNHASQIINSAGEIHKMVRDFMTWATSGEGRNKRAPSQRDYLYKKMKKFKGVGPISFNQFWHSMCLCGILPPGHIRYSMVGPSSGPAKLLQTFYPYLKSAETLQKKLCDIRLELQNLGFTKVTEFFLENLMCELWRLVNRNRIFKRGMSSEQRVDALLSHDFIGQLDIAIPTKHPDVYYKNPFNGNFQHTFRVMDKELLMRPSFMENKTTGSVNLQCSIESDFEERTINVKWNGEVMRSMEKHPKMLFT